MCVGVVIINDTVLESNETFSISLTTNEPGVNVNRSETTVIIFDDDSTLASTGHHYLICCS